MKQNEKTGELLITHCKKYPNLQITDLFKYLYQSSFGCEHMVSSLEFVTDNIKKESENITQNENHIDPLDGEYSRVNLAYLKQGLSAETLGRLFFESAKEENGGIAELENKLNIARELISENKLPFSLNEFDIQVKSWKADGYPSVHHSDIFRNEYKPSYRVISNKFVPFLPFFAQLDKILKGNSGIVAIEGGSGSGKTTLSEILEKIYNCTIIHMDDFFLRPEQRTPKRYNEVGGNIDRERFLSEILIPLSNKEELHYRKFDCSTFKLTPPICIAPKKLTVIEGVYSMHPEFTKYYDFSVFLDISPDAQKIRIQKRNSPVTAERFFSEWIPLEQKYFTEMQIKDSCDMTIIVTEFQQLYI